jgi:hypothetical protein
MTPQHTHLGDMGRLVEGCPGCEVDDRQQFDPEGPEYVAAWGGSRQIPHPDPDPLYVPELEAVPTPSIEWKAGYLVGFAHGQDSHSLALVATVLLMVVGVIVGFVIHAVVAHG